MTGRICRLHGTGSAVRPREQNNLQHFSGLIPLHTGMAFAWCLSVRIHWGAM